VDCTDKCTKYGQNVVQTNGSVACSDGRGNWNGGKGAFLDPIPNPTVENPSYPQTSVLDNWKDT
jgi:hypothetical protein